MLNTDQHNPQVRKRMTFDDFKRNLRGVNDKSDFSLEFLQAIYDSIKKKEIIMPEEHVGQLGFDYAWKELLVRSKQTRPLMSCHTSEFDSHMFKLVWRPVVGAITTAFNAPDDDYIAEKIIAGFRDCATLATHFKQPEVFDFIVMSLAHSTGLADALNFPRQSNFPIVEVEGQNITVSALSVRFGTSVRSQMATVVLFTILNGNVNNLRESWGPVCCRQYVHRKMLNIPIGRRHIAKSLLVFVITRQDASNGGLPGWRFSYPIVSGKAIRGGASPRRRSALRIIVISLDTVRLQLGHLD
ncbi:GDP/GTP exchange factor for ARF [Serendipita sp. 407]|nr:GDP/GTP exchange factor for ARF [Serendipita sp. 407]